MKKMVRKIFLYFLIFAISVSVFAGVKLSSVFAGELPPYDGTGNLFVNGDCSNSNAWTLVKYGDATATASFSNGAIKYTVSKFSTQYVHMMIRQSNIPLEANREYKFSFWLKCSETVKFGDTQGLMIRVYNNEGTADIKVGTKYISYTMPSADGIFEKDQWKKVECILNTNGFESVMPEGGVYRIRIHFGAGTAVVGGTETKEPNSPVEMLFDNFVLKDITPTYDGTGNLFVNGDCSNSNAWTLIKYGDATATASFSNGAIKYTVSKFSTQYVHMMIHQSNIPLEANREYKFSFWLKCSETVKFGDSQGLMIRVYNNEGNADIKVGTKYISYTLPSAYGIFPKGEWKKVEGTLNTDGFESVMPEGGVYRIRVHFGAGTAVVGGTETKEPNPPIEMLFDNFELKQKNATYTLGLTSEISLADDVVLTGGGNYQPGTKATITAAVKEGKNYVFDKWIDSKGDFVSSNPRYTFTVNGNIEYKAVFKPLPKYNVEVYVNDPTLGSVSPAGGSYNYGETVNLTAIPSGSSKFVCWEENGREVSTNLSYQVTVKGTHKIKANFAELDKHKVIFKDAGGRVLKVESVPNGQPAQPPDDKSKPGYSFEGWDTDYTNITADTTITAIYRPDSNYTVNVMNGKINMPVGGSNPGSYEFDTLITVMANNPAAFSYWQDAGGRIVSYDSTYSFYVSGNTTLTAEENITDVQRLPAAVINNVITGSSTVSFIAQCAIPSGTSFQIVEHGILLSESYDPNDVFNLGTAGIIRGRAASRTGDTGQFMITKVDAPGKKWYGRAYMIYKDGGNLVTVYSDVKSN